MRRKILFGLSLLALVFGFGLIHSVARASAQDAYDDLAALLIRANEQERSRLLESEKGRFTVDLQRAIDHQGRLLLERRDPAHAQTAFELAKGLAETLGDR